MIKTVLKAPIRWAGSKKSLMNELIATFDIDKKIYVEPFLGSGIVLLNVLNNNVYEETYVNDINRSIITLYKCIQSQPEKVCDGISILVNKFNCYKDAEKSDCYYRIREEYNTSSLDNDIDIATYFWFLMNTCYNGVYRVNANGKFNVPFGKISLLNFNQDYIYKISKIIKSVKFYNLDYTDFLNEISNEIGFGETFMYCDPPYISDTASMKNQILYTTNKFEHLNFLNYLENMGIIRDSSIMISMSKSEQADEVYNRYFDISRDLADLLRRVNPAKKVKVTEEAFFNYANELQNE